MTAKKTPSGKWKARVYDYIDADGRQHMKSFTAPTKAEAERMANEYIYHRDRLGSEDLTVDEAIEGYISAKDNILSPSTIKGYRSLQRNNYKMIGSKKINRLNTRDLQIFVSSLAADGHEPKTIHNIYGLLSSALSFYMPDRIFRVTLPKKARRKQTAPSDDDIKLLYESASDRMKKCIALAAFGSLRRGEICAIKYGDISGNAIYVHADVIQAPDKSWVYKDIPKTSDSVRTVHLPKKVIQMLGNGDPDQFVIDCFPCNISDSYLRLRKKLGLSIRFHDLRHYYASIGAVLGIPDVYLADFGGWSANSRVMKEVYQNKIVPLSEMYSEKMVKHFEGLI